MDTPICDFIENYIQENKVRLHMPGHKGKSFLGFEALDITEFTGADSLYHPSGIIKKSEENATALFGSGKTLYSTEGSSHCIRAMLYLIKAYGAEKNAHRSYVLAARNAHSSFISACVLNDLDVMWLYPREKDSYLSCVITPNELENTLTRVDKMPLCVYATSPDYLGNLCDIKGLSRVCKAYNIPLVVDNAHGAYLKFLQEDLHPISLGATMCCDSAHKTLPVLTGGAYLHISKDASEFFMENAKGALALFGSTSPSYLTLASLDRANRYIAQDYPKRLHEFVCKLNRILDKFSFCTPRFVFKREPMKITLQTGKLGHRGVDFANALEENGIFCEFYDNDFVVLMPTLENEEGELLHLSKALEKIPRKEPLSKSSTSLVPPKKVLSPRDAAFAPRELVSIDNALGRILAVSSVSCPPAVSLIVGGEEFNESTVKLCREYGFESFFVVKRQPRKNF